MGSVIRTVAFQGIDATRVDVQSALHAGLPGFSIVGLPDKTVSEAKERIRSVFAALSIALPPKKITVNLSPADLPKRGSHFDLPIALAILTEMGLIPKERAEGSLALGELSLMGDILPVAGLMPAALTAVENDYTLFCPETGASDAAWIAPERVFGARKLQHLLAHFSGRTPITPAEPSPISPQNHTGCFRDVKGQERAKRALEIAAAGRHHLLLIGPPGSGKSMLAARFPTILPPLTPQEFLDTSLIQSVAGLQNTKTLSYAAPFREPHHTASMAAMVGGGQDAAPGEISLAHNGVLFLDELPEFSRPVLETLRQPLETGQVVIARANAHMTYPCRFLLLAAANPCRCGHLADPNKACNRAPICGEDYLKRLSGPLLDRFDMRLDIPPVFIADLDTPPTGDDSPTIRHRVMAARDRQTARFDAIKTVQTNADLAGEQLEAHAALRPDAKALLRQAADRFGLSARGYHRIIRVARTIADLSNEDDIRDDAIAEAISYRIEMD
ncbi:MAG: YifB family Mg chelatase-like AAA ATPase [Halocynthiibacter sp.]